MSGNFVSSAYPTNFGRAFALAYFCLNDNLHQDRTVPLRTEFVEKMVLNLPEPGHMSPEDSRIDIRPILFAL